MTKKDWNLVPNSAKKAFKTHKEAVKILFLRGAFTNATIERGSLVLSQVSIFRHSMVSSAGPLSNTRQRPWFEQEKSIPVPVYRSNNRTVKTWTHPDETVKVYRDLDIFVKQFGFRPCPMFCRTWSGSKLIAWMLSVHVDELNASCADNKNTIINPLAYKYDCNIAKPDVGPNCFKRISADRKMWLAGRKLKWSGRARTWLATCR